MVFVESCLRRVECCQSLWPGLVFVENLKSTDSTGLWFLESSKQPVAVEAVEDTLGYLSIQGRSHDADTVDTLDTSTVDLDTLEKKAQEDQEALEDQVVLVNLADLEETGLMAREDLEDPVDHHYPVDLNNL